MDGAATSDLTAIRWSRWLKSAQRRYDNRKPTRASGDPLALKRRPDIPVLEDAVGTVIGIRKPTWRDGGKSAHYGNPR